MRWLEAEWYRPSHTLWTFLLLPLAWIFQFIISIRFFLYKTGILKTIHFKTPVIVVGNITVGGTGKTPFVLWLVDCLKQKGYRPGIVARGVGGKIQHSYLVKPNSDSLLVGDEALLLAKGSQCPVMIGKNRANAINSLLQIENCNVIISDDGLQHYRMGRVMEIVLIDGERGLGNQSLIPAGPLRESQKRLESVDFVVVQNGKSQEKYQMTLKGDILVSLMDSQKTIPISDFQNQTIHAVAGIGNPKRFFTYLKNKKLKLQTHIFADHYIYAKNDIFFKDELPVIMTEKDAVKCFRFADKRHWFLPVKAEITKGLDEKIIQLLTEKCRGNK